MTKKTVIAQGRKFAQVIEGARDVFLRDGYAGASVDDIARAARVSKATLYAYFPDKRLMFEEAVKLELAELCADEPFQVSPSSSAQDSLARVLHQIARWGNSAKAIGLYRLHMAESGRFPELAEGYCRTIRARLHDPLEQQLTHWSRRGELSVEDCGLAATQLVALATAPGARPSNELWAGVPDEVSRAQTEAAAALFLRANRASPSRAAAV